MQFIFIILFLTITMSCDSAQVEAPERGQPKDNKDNTLNQGNPDNDSNLQSGDAKGDPQRNDSTDTDGPKYDGNGGGDKDDQDSDTASDDDNKDDVDGKDDGDQDTGQDDGPIIIPVYEQFTGAPNTINNFNYDVEKNGFDKVAFVIFAENSVAGLQPLYNCSDDGVPVNFISNSPTCEGFTVIRKLGYTYVDFSGENRDSLIRCYNLGKRDHAVDLGQNISNDVCSTSNYKPVGPLGGTPHYEATTDANGVKSYKMKASE